MASTLPQIGLTNVEMIFGSVNLKGMMGNVDKLLCDVYFFPDLNAYKVFFVLAVEMF